MQLPSPRLGIDLLTDRDQSIRFMEKLKRAGVGPEGQLGKLDAVSNTLKYYKTQLLKDATSTKQVKADLILTTVQGWKATLRKDKRKVRAKYIEETPNEGLSFDEVNQLVECSQMWEEFDDICCEGRRGGGCQRKR